MKKVVIAVLALILALSMVACGGNKPAADTPPDTASANGLTAKIVAVHKTTDSNGAPLAAVEIEMTNENSDPIAFMGNVQVQLFQGGKQMTASNLYLDQNYDWDSQYAAIKDGASISVFVPEPLEDDSPVEVTVQVLDVKTHKVAASATMEMELVA